MMGMKTPWAIQLSTLQGGGEVIDADGSYLFSFSATQAEAVSLAVLCVNACAGINPEAVPGLVKAAGRLANLARAWPYADSEEQELRDLAHKVFAEIAKLKDQIAAENEMESTSFRAVSQENAALKSIIDANRKAYAESAGKDQRRIMELEARLPGPFDITVGGVKVGEIPEPSLDGTCNPECAVNVSPWFHGDHWQCGFMWDGKAPRKAENSYYQHSPGESCPRHPDNIFGVKIKLDSSIPKDEVRMVGADGKVVIAKIDPEYGKEDKG